jgi:hypothetical protein
MRLVGFTIEIYHDARPFKRQKYFSYSAKRETHFPIAIRECLYVVSKTTVLQNFIFLDIK